MVVYLRKSVHSLLSLFKKKAGPKGNDDHKRLAVHYSTSQHYQENVFIEGSRPQHLEELHTQAQEGLKILQREEHENGVDFLNNDTDASTDTLRREQDVSLTDDGGCSVSTASTGMTDATVTSAASTRPVLTRQGSTFKPLNPVKRLDKSRRRSRRTTIMGIPNQVHKELALHRSSALHLASNHKQVTESKPGVVTVPTVNGGTPAANKEGARVHLPELEVSTDEKLLRNHLQAVYQDEKPFNQAFSSYLGPSSVLRPKSLAVPGITTSSSFSSSSFLMEPQGPVMSISPQATYLSTIIPNAVLPASVEVIEIDRSTSRARGNSANHGGSVRTVSKSSLASLDSSVSPSLSRRYDSDGSQTDNSNNPTPMPASVSGSNWSESQSSKTIVSHPSPISSKGSRKMCDSQSVGVNGAESQLKSGGGSLEDPTGVNTISTRSEPTSAESRVSGSGAAGEETKNKQNCTRSLSVMKTKQPPAPPQRTNSLHCNKIRNNVQINDNLSDSASHEAAPATSVEKDGPLLLTDEGKTRLRVLNSPGPTSPEAPSESGSPTQSSSDEAASAAEPLQEFNRVSPKKAPSEGGKFDRTMSPSSGYSSQSGTPTLSPKGVSQSSPDIEQRKPVKPERSMSRASSSAASPSSSLTSLSSATSDPLIQDVSTCCTSPVPQRSPTTSEPAPGLRGEVKELLNIPPPPRVRAPCPPPPETWVHNRRTFELLCGPCPHVPKVHKTTTQAEDGSTAGVKTDDREISPGLSERDTADKAMSESSPAKVPTLFATRPEDVRLGVERQDSPGTEQETLSEQDRKDTSADVQRRDETRGPVAEDPESTADQPPVTKTTLTIAHGEGWPLTGLSPETQQKETCRADVGDDVTVSDDTSEAEMDRSEVTLMQAFVIEPPKTTRISPPPTPPPAYHPTPPPSRRTPPSSVSVPPDELLGVLEEVHSAESCWPPPPPPLEGGSVFDGGEEMEFPPPPPPVMGDNGPDVDCCSTQVSVPNRPTAAVETVVESEKSSDAAETSPPRGPHLPPAAPPAEADKAEGVLQVSEDNTADVSCSPVQGSDGPPPPSADRADSPSLSAPLDSLTTPSPCDALISVPVAPPLPVDNPPAGVHFRRQPSVGHRDSRSKELLARHKSAPIPKEDAHIPLVTPSLLQMVRLRSVNMTDDPVKDDSEDKTTKDEAPGQNCPASSPGHQNTPQKPVRKSLSLKHPAQTGRTSGTPNTPSMRLQEAIRMKTAAMTSKEGLPCRLGMRSSICLSEPGILLKPPEAFDALKTPASTASFIFSRSSRKLVLETAAAPSPEPQARVKQNLATELMQLHDPSNAAAFCNGRLKSDRRPPPVARKPAPSSGNASHIPKMELSVDGTISVQPTRETTPPETTTRVTADTIETLF